MPIVKTGGKIIFYAHIPKCGGSSVEDYLAERFGPVGFLDTRYMSRPEAMRWTRTSPQHVDRDALATLLPRPLIDAAFTVVRHPVSRILSVYRFQRDVENQIPADLPFPAWLENLEASLADDPFQLDGHARPQTDFLPERCTLFHLEHGLDRIIPYLDRIAGTSDGRRRILHLNNASDRAGKRQDIKPTDEDVARIARIYAEDFRVLSYLPNTALPTAAPSEATATMGGAGRRDPLMRPRDWAANLIRKMGRLRARSSRLSR